jgi:hypothetical protein
VLVIGGSGGCGGEHRQGDGIMLPSLKESKNIFLGVLLPSLKESKNIFLGGGLQRTSALFCFNFIRICVLGVRACYSRH